MSERMTNRGRAFRPARGVATAILLALVVALAAGSCSHEERVAPPPPLLVIGVDGLEWDLVLRFGAEGVLPNLMQLAREGFAAKLETLDPTLSPVIWTTIATGKRPEKHGILGFSYVGPDQQNHLYLSLHRQSKALWNLFDDAGKTTRVYGWWCTLPIEEIRGSMVAQTTTRAQIDISHGDRIWKGSFLPVEGLAGQVHPEELAPRMNAVANGLADRIGAGDDPMRRTFGDPGELNAFTKSLWDAVRSSLYADCIFRDGVIESLEQHEPFDAFLVYFGVTDVASHMFWRHFEPQKFDHPPPAAEVEQLGHVIRDSYRWVDDAIGRLRRAAPDADVLVLSDHGFHEANVHDDFGSEKGRADSGHHLNQPAGVLLAAGRSFRRSPLKDGAIKDDVRSIGHVEDVLPTLLARVGLPYGEDMDGRPMKGLLSEELLRAHPVASVRSHEDAEWRAARKNAAAHALEWERKFEEHLHFTGAELARLQKLGYVGAQMGMPDPPQPPKQQEKDDSRKPEDHR
jgi:predicted AlkP superfamily pyrophosphatase or phosphodiesterase